MTIKVGDHLPQSTFRLMTSDGAIVKTTDDLFKERKVVLFAVPGAFTPTCNNNHLPSFLEHAEEIKSKGIDAIYVTGVNDVFVMNAWAKATQGEDKITFLSDGNGDFAKAIGLSMDGSGFGLGIRSQRYAMIVNDGIVQTLNIEDSPAKAEASTADKILEALSH